MPAGFPSDLVLTLASGVELRTHWHPLRMTSNVLCDSPESASLSVGFRQVGALLGWMRSALRHALPPHLQVDGSQSAWAYIMAHPLYDAPALTLGGVFSLLPVAHKYGFTQLITRLVDYIKGQTLLPDPQHPIKYIISWIALAERVQLDDLLEQRVAELEKMSGDELAQALLLGSNSGTLPAVLREQMEELRPDTRDRLLAMSTSRLRDTSRREMVLKSEATAAETDAKISATIAEVAAEDKLQKFMDYAKERGFKGGGSWSSLYGGHWR
jgi:hypothetical protein